MQDICFKYGTLYKLSCFNASSEDGSGSAGAKTAIQNVISSILSNLEDGATVSAAAVFATFVEEFPPDTAQATSSASSTAVPSSYVPQGWATFKCFGPYAVAKYGKPEFTILSSTAEGMDSRKKKDGRNSARAVVLDGTGEDDDGLPPPDNSFPPSSAEQLAAARSLTLQVQQRKVAAEEFANANQSRAVDSAAAMQSFNMLNACLQMQGITPEETASLRGRMMAIAIKQSDAVIAPPRAPDFLSTPLTTTPASTRPPSSLSMTNSSKGGSATSSSSKSSKRKRNAATMNGHTSDSDSNYGEEFS